MSSLNKVFLVGRLGQDPELRTTQSGKSVATFSLATTEKSKEGAKTEWHKIVVWDKTADIAKKFLTKGKLCHVEGKIQSHEYESQGIKKVSYEIHCTSLTLLEFANDKADNDDVPF